MNRWSLMAVVALALQVRGEAPGPAVGAKAPEFSARDQNGRSWTRAGLSGKRGLMLVFYRSADW